MKDRSFDGEKITLEEYQKKYTTKLGSKAAGKILGVAVFVVALIVFACLFFLVKDIYEMNEYAGYGACAVGVIFYLFFLVIPLIKIFKLEKFELDLRNMSANKAKKKNSKIRTMLAEKIINCYSKTEDGAVWYSADRINGLITAVEEKNNEEIKNSLCEIYSTDIKVAANKIVRKCSVRAGAYSAISQNDKLDTAIVTAINLQMVKDILYLYGFRPTEQELLKIFGAVLRASLVSYGMGTVSGSVGTAVGGLAVKAIPVLGAAIGTLVDSSVQGIANGTVTAIIGFKTIKYLMHDFHLQNVLDNVQVDVTEEDFKLTCAFVKDELKSAQRGRNAEKTQAV